MRGPVWLIGLAWLVTVPSAALSSDLDVEQITVEIQGRTFIPGRVVLHAGRKTTLQFRNHDTELHAVVAKELFLGVNLNVGGNGAPEFGPDGLTRVIIPLTDWRKFSSRRPAPEHSPTDATCQAMICAP